MNLKKVTVKEFEDFLKEKGAAAKFVSILTDEEPTTEYGCVFENEDTEDGVILYPDCFSELDELADEN